MLLPFFAEGQLISTFAGGGTSGLGDGGTAITASISDPITGAFDQMGNCYIVSGLGGNRIRKIDTAGIITTFAGNGTAGYGGDGFAATNAELNVPRSIAIDPSGNIYIADGGNNAIRKISIATGVISTIAGTGVAGYNGDNISATSAMLNEPNDICFDRYGNLFIADEENNRIRKIDATGIITTFAGNGVYGYSGDNGQATAAQLWLPWSLAIDDKNNLYISDLGNFRIRKVSTSGVISTFAGSSTNIYAVDGVPATDAGFYPDQIRFNTSNQLFIGDFDQNYRVLMIDTFGIIHSIAGNGNAGFSGDGGPATAAEFDYPGGLAFDRCDNLYITDIDAKRVRKAAFHPSCLPLKEPEVPQNQITIYPNPATLELNIDGVTAETNYALFNVLGIIEQSGILKKGNNTIAVQTLPAGIYILELIDDEGRKLVKKVVKE